MHNLGICSNCNSPFTLFENQAMCGGSLTSFSCKCNQSVNKKDIELTLNFIDKSIENFKQKAAEDKAKHEEALELLFTEMKNQSSVEKRLAAIETDLALIKSLLLKNDKKIIKD